MRKNYRSGNVATIEGCIWNDSTRTVARAVNINADILKNALDRIAELEKQIEFQEEEQK
jgi:hypothetical protein